MKKIFVTIRIIVILAMCLTNIASAAKEINIVTTTTDLMDLVKMVGGKRVKVVSLSHGDQSGCAGVEPRPSMVIYLRSADMLVRIGMDYDHWADSLIDASRNSKIVYGANGYVDVSVGINRLEVPKGKVDASMGHIHLYGNPHYWLDPHNAKVITKNIYEGLCRISPKNSNCFKENRDEFLLKIDMAIQEWSKKLKIFQGKKFVSYHTSWVYFAKCFGLNIVGTLEPKSGIPPSPAHLRGLIKMMKKEGISMILHENYYPQRTTEMVSKETGAKILILPVSVGGLNGKIEDYFSLFNYIVNKITEKESKNCE
ncbi:MAG: metal ABC transporter substrate-binding protein [bacterium]|nr:metal ABC transporter substrate-binding protein [bacterium]